MRAMYLIALKDVMVLFRSPLAYIILTCFLLVSGYFFSSMIRFYELFSMQMMQNPGMADMSPMDMVVGPYLQNISVVLLFFLPLLTMRGFSEEKRMGTFEMLVSYPVTETQIVGGKLLALAVFLLAAMALGAVSPLLLFLYTEPAALPMLAGYLGLFLLGLSFVAIGLFLSSLTESQVTAAVLSFVALLLLWLFSWLEQLVPQNYQAVVAGLSILSHFENFTKGVLELQDLVYYITFILGFSWLSVLSLENQRWRA